MQKKIVYTSSIVSFGIACLLLFQRSNTLIITIPILILVFIGLNLFYFPKIRKYNLSTQRKLMLMLLINLPFVIFLVFTLLTLSKIV